MREKKNINSCVAVKLQGKTRKGSGDFVSAVCVQRDG